MRILKQLNEKDEFDVGVKIEHEHAPTLKKIIDFYEKYSQFPDIELLASWIATDHVNEHPDYYSQDIGLPNMERELKRLESNK